MYNVFRFLERPNDTVCIIHGIRAVALTVTVLVMGNSDIFTLRTGTT